MNRLKKSLITLAVAAAAVGVALPVVASIVRTAPEAGFAILDRHRPVAPHPNGATA
ncbi:hypothetical protein [Streptomyces sp. NPDC048611]|uniref:hypothetical protein n=1 Tax=Streptomyces sp. NPDC048611 TaxID=3155635 RepID=UPI003442E7BA